MKTTKKKPDLLAVLAVFVGLGVMISTYTQSTSPVANGKSVTADTNSKESPSKTENSVYNGDYIFKSHQSKQQPSITKGTETLI